MESVDGVAYIGRNPGDKNIYVVTGDSGNGITHGTLAGTLIIDLIAGRENPWGKLIRSLSQNVEATSAGRLHRRECVCRGAISR